MCVSEVSEEDGGGGERGHTPPMGTHRPHTHTHTRAHVRRRHVLMALYRMGSVCLPHAVATLVGAQYSRGVPPGVPVGTGQQCDANMRTLMQTWFHALLHAQVHAPVQVQQAMRWHIEHTPQLLEMSPMGTPMALYRSRPKNQQMAENSCHAGPPMEAGVAAVHTWPAPHATRGKGQGAKQCPAISGKRVPSVGFGSWNQAPPAQCLRGRSGAWRSWCPGPQ